MTPKMHCLIGAALVISLCSSTAQAEDLLQVYRQMQDSYPMLKAAAAIRESAQEKKVQARALFLPRAEISLDRKRTFGATNSRATGLPDAYSSHSYTAGMTQPLYNRGSQVQDQLADVAIQQADVDLHNTQSDVLFQMAQGYFNVLLELDTLSFTTTAKNAFARQLEQANRRFEVGLATITDVYDAQASFDSAVSEEVGAVNRLANARELLRQLTGQEYTHISALSERMPLVLPTPTDPEAWVKIALENNLKLRSGTFDVDKARETVQLQKAGHYPTLSLNASRTTSDSNDTEVNSSQATLGLRIPLYSGGAVSSEVRQAAYSYEAARQNLESLQRETIRTVRNAYRGQETAISQIKALNQMRISTRSALEANKAGYDVGTRTIVDVLNAERNVYQAEASYAKARYTYVVNLLTLRQAAGQLEEKDIAEINTWLGQPRATDGSPLKEQEVPKDVAKDKESPAPTKKKIAPEVKSEKKPRVRTRQL